GLQKRNTVIPSGARRSCGRSRGICSFFLSLPPLDTFFLTRDFSHAIIIVYSLSFENSAPNLSRQLPCFHSLANASPSNPLLLILIQRHPGWGCPTLLELASFFGLLSKDRKTSPYFSLSCAFFAENNRGITLPPPAQFLFEHLLRRAPFASWDRLSLPKTLR